jgi:aminoglycoside 6'-N-acetyltransferase
LRPYVREMTGRITLREVSPGDISVLNELLQHPDVREWWTDYDEDKLREEVADPSHEVFTIEVDGAPAGLLEVTEEDDPDYRNVALDIFLGAPYHGQGLGAEALRMMLRRMFEKGHHRATIDPAVDNVKAIRSYERVGFKRVGVLREADRSADGVWRDALMMDLLAGELR